MTLSAKIAATAANDTTVIAAPGAGKRIAFRYAFSCDTDIVVIFKSGSTAITGSLKVGVNGVASSPIWLYCAANEALVINLSGTAVVGGHVEYEVQSVG